MSFNVNLFWTLMVREIEARYRGSILGAIWSILTPLCMLAVFTFVFAVVLRARWGEGEATTLPEFGLILFAGLTTFTVFSEVVSRAPTLVSTQANLVKKVVFPLEILPAVALGSALFQTAVSIAILLAFQLAVGSSLQRTAFAVPVLMAPLALFTLGLAWFLSSLGVYVRDVGQIIQPIVTALMFLSPIFYPVSALPEWLQGWLLYSPIASSVETVRGAVLFGRLPDAAQFLVSLAVGLAVAALGLAFFQKTRKGFADVL